MQTAAAKPVASTSNLGTRPRFDYAEAGRKGGIASGVARRRKRKGGVYWLEALRDELAADPATAARALLRSRNGAAIAAALQLVREYERGKQVDLRRLDQQLEQTDQRVCDLLDEVGEETARRDRLRAEVDELSKQRRELSARLETDGGVDEWLQELGEERIEASVSRLGWLDHEGSDAVAPAAA